MDSVTQDKSPLQLPNCVREAYLGIDAYKTALTLDLLFTLGYKEGDWVTYQEALNIGADYTAVHIIRDGLKHETIKRRKLPQEKPGRPTFAYQLPQIDELKHDLVVEWSSVTDILSLEDFANGKTYRMALHRELIQRGFDENDHRPKAFSRKLMCERLNVSPKTLRTYEQELKTYVRPRYDVISIDAVYKLYLVPEKRSHNGQFLTIVSRDGAIRKLPAIKKVAGMYLKQGYELSIVQRKTNEYAPFNPYSEQAHRAQYGQWADFIEY